MVIGDEVVGLLALEIQLAFGVRDRKETYVCHSVDDSGRLARTGGTPPPKVEAALPRAYSEAEQAAIDAKGAPLTDDEVRNRTEALRNAR